MSGKFYHFIIFYQQSCFSVKSSPKTSLSFSLKKTVKNPMKFYPSPISLLLPLLRKVPHYTSRKETKSSWLLHWLRKDLKLTLTSSSLWMIMSSLLSRVLVFSISLDSTNLKEEMICLSENKIWKGLKKKIKKIWRMNKKKNKNPKLLLLLPNLSNNLKNRNLQLNQLLLSSKKVLKMKKMMMKIKINSMRTSKILMKTIWKV